MAAVRPHLQRKWKWKIVRAQTRPGQVWKLVKVGIIIVIVTIVVAFLVVVCVVVARHGNELSSQETETESDYHE